MTDQQNAPGIIASNPVITTAIPSTAAAVVNFLVIMGWLHMTSTQVSGFNIALTSVIGTVGLLIAKAKVTPNVVLDQLKGFAATTSPTTVPTGTIVTGGTGESLPAAEGTPTPTLRTGGPVLRGDGGKVISP